MDFVTLVPGKYGAGDHLHDLHKELRRKTTSFEDAEAIAAKWVELAAGRGIYSRRHAEAIAEAAVNLRHSGLGVLTGECFTALLMRFIDPSVNSAREERIARWALVWRIDPITQADLVDLLDVLRS